MAMSMAMAPLVMPGLAGYLSLAQAGALLRRTKCGALGLDVSWQRIGVALSRDQVSATPLKTLYRPKKNPLDLSQIVQEISVMSKAHDVGLLVVGWPIEKNGLQGKQCASVLEIVQDLRRTGLATPLTFFDERYTTQMAHDRRGDAVSKRWMERTEDQLAAMTILETLLGRALSATAERSPIDRPLSIKDMF
ncbi:hypothetical protein M885DRAFT_512930 [Pelagophyceae sp. CCMP2097]|nr:hypothetical protein M885DRAFT_512930 [Pelagophyceae sp. CCMP2097]|mmetsp:Transcript_13272/g.46043  ORF Transcript_13272/g.46043 Transcript_13272/m.46043 type:complete len:192 (-) Transcript_13272:1-576(-)